MIKKHTLPILTILGIAFFGLSIFAFTTQANAQTYKISIYQFGTPNPATHNLTCSDGETCKVMFPTLTAQANGPEQTKDIEISVTVSQYSFDFQFRADGKILHPGFFSEEHHYFNKAGLGMRKNTTIVTVLPHERPAAGARVVPVAQYHITVN